MVIQLNLPALERLLAGDSEIELGLRQQIVEQFANKHLKKMIKEYTESEVYKSVCEKLRSESRAAISELIYKNTHPDSAAVNNEVRFSGFRDTVDKMIISYVEEALKKHIKDRIEYYSDRYLRHIQERVESVLNQEIEKRIREGVAERLDKIKQAAEG